MHRHAQVAGGANISVAAPEWAPNGALVELVYVSDESGWWNLHSTANPGCSPPQALAPRPAEFGGPAWELGWQPFRVLPDGRCATALQQMQSWMCLSRSISLLWMSLYMFDLSLMSCCLSLLTASLTKDPYGYSNQFHSCHSNWSLKPEPHSGRGTIGWSV